MRRGSVLVLAVALFVIMTGGAAGVPAQTAAAQPAVPSASSSSAFVKDFQEHWTTAKGLAVAVAEAMPEGDYAFKPNADEMSFGQQITHITQANYGYCAFLADAKSPFTAPSADAKPDKAAAVKQLGESFDYCSAALAKVADADLDKKHGSGDRQFAARDVILGLLVHMAHHRGQVEVYLRLKGIVPPKYQW